MVSIFPLLSFPFFSLLGHRGLLFHLGSETDLKSLEIFHTPNCIYYYFWDVEMYLSTLVITVNWGFGQHEVAWCSANRLFSRSTHTWRFSWSSCHLRWGNHDTWQVFWCNNEVNLNTTRLSLDLEVGHLWPDLWFKIWPWRRSLQMNIDRITNLLLNSLSKQLPQGGNRREREKPSSTLKKKKVPIQAASRPNKHIFLSFISTSTLWRIKIFLISRAVNLL